MMLCAFREGLDRSFDRLVTLLQQSDATTIVGLSVTPSDPILQYSAVTGNATSDVTFSLAVRHYAAVEAPRQNRVQTRDEME